ncbi:MAG: hypothetical protein AAFO69_12905 [Bacteroidota bacterium]
MQIPETTQQLKKSISKGDTLHLFYIPYAPKQIKTADDLTYFSFRFGEMHQTQGAVVGTPLDGPYELFYKRILLAKGNYNKGLKNGLWYQWNVDGLLMSVIEYRNGKRNGLSKFYGPEGEVEKFQQYKNDLKQGIGLYENAGKAYYLKYRAGEVIDTLETLSKAQQLRYGLGNIR